MRKALGLAGTAPQSEPGPEPVKPVHHPPIGSGFGGHRRRFVQDGDIPVTVVRRDPAVPPGATRQPLALPTVTRLQQLETQLAAAAAARAQAERALAEAQCQIRDLQTKLGHAELARDEALEAARRAQQAEQALADLQGTLAEERVTRTAAERALRLAEEARQTAERRVREHSAVSSVRSRRAATKSTAAEPEPVKWWLIPA